MEAAFRSRCGVTPKQRVWKAQQRCIICGRDMAGSKAKYRANPNECKDCSGSQRRLGDGAGSVGLSGFKRLGGKP